MKKRKKIKLITRKDVVGYLFLAPFLIGFIFLFLKPMIESFIYSFHEITVDAGGIVLKNVGLENYRQLLFGDGAFVKQLLTLGGDIALEVIVIMFVSMFVAVLLNRKFTGRLFFRTVMFLPVIFGADAVMEVYNNYVSKSRISLSGADNMFIGAGVGEAAEGFLNEVIQSFGAFSEVITMVTAYVSNIFSVAWDIGIQIILFIIGLQAIPRYLYEVCELEGATKWESFWKITFPMLSPTMLLCLIYTLIDAFNSSNQIMTIIEGNMRTRVHYACAMTWFYSALIFVLVFIVYKVTSRKVIYMD